ncbi:hypothetical protein EUX98_g3346 [Antrodiella citrinella]|uniref:Uncharacterized protein n=1 Tax=Antrodiella citrinella TaxID=2447956 RepID=A0A4S4MWT4_9APHY|nr:hypothetical protein EUX98_g3346 [Antrodiella citrinella]
MCAGPYSTLYSLDKLRGHKDEQIIQYWMVHVVYDFMLYGATQTMKKKPPPEAVMSSGLTRFVKNVIDCDEPLALLSIAKWIEEEMSMSLTRFLDFQLSMDNNDSPFVFEKAATVYLGHALNGSETSTLEQVSTFYTAVPEWAKLPAQLVAVTLDLTSGTHTFSTVKFGSSIHDLPSSQLGMKTNSTVQTIDWLRDPRGVPFLFPDNSYGPDSVVLVRLQDNTFVWIVTQMKMLATRQLLDRGTSNDAISSVTPFNFFQRGNITKANQESLKANALSRMARIVEGHGPLRILRVVVAYDAVMPNNIQAYPNGLETDGQYPLARLRQPDYSDLTSPAIDKTLRNIIDPRGVSNALGKL